MSQGVLPPGADDPADSGLHRPGYAPPGSDQSARAALEPAFRRAEYWIGPATTSCRLLAAADPNLDSAQALGAAGWLLTRIEQPCAALAKRLAELGCSSAQLLTPCNPRGLAAGAAGNQQAMQRLAERLRAAQARWLPSLAMDRDGGWREPGVLLLAEPVQAGRWAEEFEQAAWVEYDAAGCGQLRWTQSPTQPVANKGE